MSNFLQSRHRLIKSINYGLQKEQEAPAIRKDEYEALVQFQLKRQKQKTKMLEQRILNKQIFIQQMNQYQTQLSLAFEKCQQELCQVKERLKYYQNYETDSIRRYVQQIAELKHLIIRLEDQINIYQAQNRKIYGSAKKQQNYQFNKKQRSKTLMHDDQNDNIYKYRSIVERQLEKEKVKVGNFIDRFLSMVQIYCRQVNTDKIKVRLRIGWRWIKNVVKEWHFLKNKVKQLKVFCESKIKSYRLGQSIKNEDILRFFWQKLRDVPFNQ